MIMRLKDILIRSGAVAGGALRAEYVEDRAWESYLDWINNGCQAGMGYMENHLPIRRDPRLLLEGAETIISLAFPFKPLRFRDSEKGMIACYAYGSDYHDVIRARLNKAVGEMKECFGGEYRICIDSAPIMERYWAAQIFERGDNGSVIVPGYGNMVFLAEILTTLPLERYGPLFLVNASENGMSSCNHCGRCRKACPAGAILADGRVDSRRCLSYLTIEHRGEWTSPEAIEATQTEAGKNLIFGCDLCLRCCPLNRNTPPSDIEEFDPREEVMNLTKEDVKQMKQEDFSRIFKGSPIKRCKLNGLKRNIGEFSE